MGKKAGRFMNLAVVLTTMLITQVSHAKLVALWTFDEMSGTNVCDSVSGKKSTLKGNTKWVVGKDGKGALEFDGDGDYVDCGGGKNKGEPNTWADITGEITVSAWIKGPFAAPVKGRRAHTIIAKGGDAWRLHFWSVDRI